MEVCRKIKFTNCSQTRMRTQCSQVDAQLYVIRDLGKVIYKKSVKTGPHTSPFSRYRAL